MIITRGPGSYTGVRVAMTIAKTLSVVAPVKIKVVSSLAAYAGLQKCVSVIDARSQKVFVCVYDQGQAITSEQLMPIDDFSHFIENYPYYCVVGQSEVVHYPMTTVNLAQNMYDLSKMIDQWKMWMLVPYYLKDVEAKKICL